jgi:transposase
MAKRRFRLTEQQVNELLGAYRHCKNGSTATRYLAVRLYGTGYAVPEVMKITGGSRPSLMEWCRAYREQGVAGLLDKRKGGNRAALSAAQLEELRLLLHTYTPSQLLGADQVVGSSHYWTVAEVLQLVAQRYGVIYRSHTSGWKVLRRCGLTYQKAAKVFKSRSARKVAEFEELFEKS